MDDSKEIEAANYVDEMGKERITDLKWRPWSVWVSR